MCELYNFFKSCVTSQHPNKWSFAKIKKVGNHAIAHRWVRDSGCVTLLSFEKGKEQSLPFNLFTKLPQFITMPLNAQDIPIKILLAEDDTDDRFFFNEALKEIPVVTELTVVNDGEQLMEYLLSQPGNLPDLLFLDLSMPRKNGFECLVEINENNRLKDIPVIVFSTSYTKDSGYELEMVNRLYKMGAINFIRKTSDFAQIKQIIQNALDTVIEKRQH